MPDGPLANLRVLEFTDEIGAYCGKLLADLGADVIKVEPPGGGVQRRTPPFLDGDPGPDASIPFWSQNSSKRSLILDLDREADRARARELALGADIILEDHAARRTLASHGLGYDDLYAASAPTSSTPRLPASARPALTLASPTATSLVRRWAA